MVDETMALFQSLVRDSCTSDSLLMALVALIEEERLSGSSCLSYSSVAAMLSSP